MGLCVLAGAAGSSGWAGGRGDLYGSKQLGLHGVTTGGLGTGVCVRGDDTAEGGGGNTDAAAGVGDIVGVGWVMEECAARCWFGARIAA